MESSSGGSLINATSTAQLWGTVPSQFSADFGGGGSSLVSIVPVSSTADESSHIFKASAGELYSLIFTNKGAAGFLMFLDSAMVPADGVLADPPASCIAVPGGSSAFPATVSLGAPAGTSLHANNGIVAVFSTTGSAVKTLAPVSGFFTAVFV
jgi:hypothetical protein